MQLEIDLQCLINPYSMTVVRNPRATKGKERGLSLQSQAGNRPQPNCVLSNSGD